MKPTEFSLRKTDNNKHTIKTPDGSFKASGGEAEVSFTFPKGTDVDEAIKFSKEKLEDLMDKDSADWLKGKPKGQTEKLKEVLPLLRKIDKDFLEYLEELVEEK